jgi:hypothetical protein
MLFVMKNNNNNRKTNLRNFFHTKLTEILQIIFKQKKKILIIKELNFMETNYNSKQYQFLRRNCYGVQENYKNLFFALKFKIKSFFWFSELLINRNKWLYVETFLKSSFLIFYKINHYHYFTHIDLFFPSNFDFFYILEIFFIRNINFEGCNNLKLIYQTFRCKNYSVSNNILFNRKNYIFNYYFDNYEMEFLQYFNSSTSYKNKWFYQIKSLLIRNLLFFLHGQSLTCKIVEKSNVYDKKILLILKKKENFLKKYVENWFNLKFKKFKNYFFLKNLVYFMKIYHFISMMQSSFSLLKESKRFYLISNFYLDNFTMWNYRYKDNILICVSNSNLINNYINVLSEIFKKIKTDIILWKLTQNCILHIDINSSSIYGSSLKKKIISEYFKIKYDIQRHAKILNIIQFREIIFYQNYSQLINKFLLAKKILIKEVSLFFFFNKNLILNNIIHLFFIFFKKIVFI